MPIRQLAIYLALGADLERVQTDCCLRLALVVALPQVYGAWRRRSSSGES